MIIFIYLFFLLAAWTSPDLHPIPTNASTVYNQQIISITCRALRTQLLEWQSEEYLGRGKSVSVRSSHQPGMISNELDLGIIVSVISTRNTPGDEVIESEIRISASSNFSNITITCLNVDHNTMDSVIYHTTGK